MKTGVELIAQERDEQINKHGFSIEKDKEFYQEKELLSAALCCLFQDESLFLDQDTPAHPADYWPGNWDDKFLDNISRKNRIEQLQIAGALIAAEIDRLQFINSLVVTDETKRRMVEQYGIDDDNFDGDHLNRRTDENDDELGY